MEMESTTFDNYNLQDGKPNFTTANETPITAPKESFAAISSVPESRFSAMAAPFQSRNDLLTLISQHEPRQADPAPATTEIDDLLLNLRINSTNLLMDDTDQSSTQNYYMGASRSETVTPPHSNTWMEGAAGSANRNGDIETFDFLVKSISSANNYVSMLTREQLYVLRSIRPSLLYEFLQEVAKVRRDKRMRRPLPNECAFCKNNGENEEYYSSHSLKDYRGRVLCPVLRAFRCPRCGATGDRAHTIKYCNETLDGGLERSGNLSARRRASASLSPGHAAHAGVAPPPAAPTSPNPSLAHHPLWSGFGIN